VTTASFTARLVTLCTSAAVLVAGCQGTEPEATPEPIAPPTTVSASPSPVPTSAAADPARDPAFAPYYEQKLRWSRCDQGFECSTLTVPLDHAKPTGETIKVSVLRVPASGPGKRIGSLVVNPGGPGGDGLDHAREAQSYFTKPVRQRYDIVGFDPRGVATSMPIDCLNDRETDRLVALDGSPDDAAERQALVKESQFFGQRCKERAGKLLPHIGTPDVARDLDILRAALGDARLHYVGRSYGTLIGAVYAEQFPSRVGRMVLDGAEDPRVSGVDMALAQARGFEQAVNGFVADCVLRSSCPLGRTRSTAKQRLADLLDRVDRRPLPGHDARKLTQSLAILGVVAAMYNEVDGWPALRVALSYALDGDGSGLMLLSDLYTDREDGRYQNNSNEVIYAVNCLDHPDTRTPAEIERQLPEFRKASPLLGDYLAWGSLPCTYWPVQSGSRPHAITAPGAPPILVVGTTRDPATPYAWSQGLAGQLESGVLLTYEGDGHTAYARGNGCIDRAVETYLLSGKPPADGRRCG
jgi:pimeloyl-ACP methyl ester carboxylesterase